MSNERIQVFLEALGASARSDVRVYLTGGATAVSYGWRSSTIDIDLRLEPEQDEMMRALPALKERLSINVETVSPDQFIPVRAGWEDRSRFVGRFGRMSVYHYDLYAQALSKLERGHARDVQDVEAMCRLGLVQPLRLLEEFELIVPFLHRYPAIDPASFRLAVTNFVGRERPALDGGSPAAS